MKTYRVTVHDNGTICWYKEETKIKHCEHGPAVIYSNSSKSWCLDNKYYTEEDFSKEMKRRNNSCDGTIIEIEGKKYKLTEV